MEEETEDNTMVDDDVFASVDSQFQPTTPNRGTNVKANLSISETIWSAMHVRVKINFQRYHKVEFHHNFWHE